MVSKIAVMALVAVIAVPILLGYAFNLTETTETEYKASGEAVNVTPLLQTGTNYSYASASVYQLNTNFSDNVTVDRFIPMYLSKGTDKSSLNLLQRDENTPGQTPPDVYLNTWFDIYSISLRNNAFSVSLYENGTLVTTLTGVHDIYFSRNEGKVNIDGTIYSGSNMNIKYTLISTNNTTFIESWAPLAADNNNWVDFSGGFKFVTSFNILHNYLNLPTNTRQITLTINLDSITSSTHTMKVELPHSSKDFQFKKDSSGQWSAGFNLDMTNIYTDPGRSDNTYQLTITFDKERTVGANTWYVADYKLDYVGSWPTSIGIANSYQSYSFNDYFYYANDSYTLNYVEFSNAFGEYPIMRVDNGIVRAFEHPVISDTTYSPAQFKTNPTTNITDVQQYGSSIGFGGNTYTVTDGKITISGHKIPVNGIVFSSVPNGLGTYDNKIGNTIISTTATPSTITFNGSWSASVATKSMDSQTVTKTEWVAGSFGWDGIDQNFLIVGLVTCLGVFVALGIYARKKGSGGLIPLMVAVGCAAAVFFIML